MKRNNHDELLKEKIHLEGLVRCCNKPAGEYNYLKGGKKYWQTRLDEIEHILKEKT